MPQVVAGDFRNLSGQWMLFVSWGLDLSMRGLLVGIHVLNVQQIVYLLMLKLPNLFLECGDASVQGSAAADGWALPVVGFWVWQHHIISCR